MFVDGIPPEGLEWQFPLLEWYQINDYLNQGFGHKDSTDPSEEVPTAEGRVIHLRNYSIKRTPPDPGIAT
jgi:hypothetical protein